MTLIELINALKKMPPTARVSWQDGTAVGRLHSWRGSYDELSLDESKTLFTAAEILADAEAAMGKCFEGYKGGDYLMGAGTPVWGDKYGECPGNAVFDVRCEDDAVVIYRYMVDEYR